MRIALVHSFYRTENPSGENQAVLDQKSVLEGAGHEVKLIARYSDAEQSQSFYKVRSALRAASLGGPDPSAEIEEFNPDIVHVHNLFPNWGTDWLRKWTDRSVATLHNFRTLCAAGWLYREGNVCYQCLDHGSMAAVRNRCYRDSAVASVPLAIATRGGGRHAATLRYPKRLIAHTPPSVGLFEQLLDRKVDLVPYFVTDLPVVRAPETADSWVFIGRLSAEKGIDWLINAWPRTERLTIIGSGPLEDLVRDAAMREPETFEFKGQVPYATARGLTSGSKGVVVSSRWPETGPLTALEALQAGTPLAVSSSIAQAGELTKNGAGVQFRIADGSAGLSAALAQLGAGEVTGEKARARYEEEFSPAVWLARIEAVYQKVLETR